MMGRYKKHITDQSKKCIKVHENAYEPGLVSIVAPCYNEEENIQSFMKAVARIDINPYRYEVIIVNDGSQDRSKMILEEMKIIYPQLQAIYFPLNFGQQQALMAGIRAALGEVIVTIDIDLQQPPDLIPDMIHLYEKGYQVVYSIPQYQNDSASWMKKFTSKLYYKWIGWMGSKGVVYKSNDFRLISHRVAEVLRGLPERNLYIRGILSWLCPLVSMEENIDDDSDLWVATTVPYRHRAREHGKTKYTWLKMIKLGLDGLTSTSIQPLRFGLFLGAGSILLAFGLSAWALYMHLIAGQTVSGWTSLMIVVLFFSSMQFILLGLVGEYIGKIFLQIRGRPGYIPHEDNVGVGSTSKSYIPQDKNANKPHRRKAKTSKGRILESKVPLKSRHPP